MERRSRRAAGLIAAVMGCIWLGIFPLASDFTYTHITHTKWVIALALGGATLLGGIAAALLQGHGRKGEEAGRRFPDPLRIIGALYFLWVCLSAAFGVYAGSVNDQGQLTVLWGAKRYEGLITQLCYGAVFLGMSAVTNKKTPLVVSAAVSVLAGGIVTLMQHMHINVLKFYPAGRSIFTNYEFQGLLGNIDMNCGFLLMAIPLLIGGWIFLRSRWRVILLIIASLGSIQLLLTEVQSGMLGIACLMLLIILLGLWKPEYRSNAVTAAGVLILTFAIKQMFRMPWLHGVEAITFRVTPVSALILAAGIAVILLGAVALRKNPGKSIRIRWIMIALVLLMLIGLLVLRAMPVPELEGEKAPNGLYQVHEILNGHVEDSYGSWRLGCWRHTLEMSFSSPQTFFFGYGPDTFWYALDDHLKAEGAYLGEHYDNPHNMYLAILVSNGLPALLLFIALLVLTVIRCLRRADAMSLTLLGGILGFSLYGMFCFSLCIISPIFWALMGMACAMREKNQS